MHKKFVCFQSQYTKNALVNGITVSLKQCPSVEHFTNYQRGVLFQEYLHLITDDKFTHHATLATLFLVGTIFEGKF